MNRQTLHRTPAPSRRRGRRGGFSVRLVIVALLTVSLGGFAIWAKGRGYKTRLLAGMFPNSKYGTGLLQRPSVTGIRPADREGGVPPDVFIAADVELPNPGKVIDKRTLEGGVLLLRGNAREKVPIAVNTSGGGDAIVVRPLEPLALNALYNVEVLPALKDTAGAPFKYYTSTFSTAAGTVYTDYPASAQKVALPPSQLPEVPPPGSNLHPKMMPSYAGITVGPDRRVYAPTTDGRIFRFEILPDSTLGPPTVIDTVVKHSKGPRLVTGLVFDPASTKDDLIAWATHGEMVGFKLNDWSGKVSRLSGPNLEQYQDYVISLPRARLDHTTDQCVFGPDGALYFCQASNTAMGAPDHEWGFRPEHTLTACVMRVDLKAIAQPPLDVKTDEGGKYDPYAPGAPLTIVATGIRNAYDILWHSNGRLYAPLNGSARGGNIPATPPGGRSPARRFDAHRGPYNGPAVPGFEKMPTQNDYLLIVEQGGYYGHPNPARAEFVMNGGNPTAGEDLCEVPQYPVGTLPDRNWRRPSFDFGKNLSPCGILEYKGDAFPALKGKILSVRFSGGKDLFVMSVGADGEVNEFITGIDGFTQFYDPLDAVEDPQTGFLYVAEHGGKRITLVRPSGAAVSTKVIRQTVTPLGATRPAAGPMPNIATTRPAQPQSLAETKD